MSLGAAKAEANTKVDLCGIKLDHPILNGSGTFDVPAAIESFGSSVLERFPFSCFVSKTITLKPREGNPPRRFWESSAGMINSIGLPNRGLEGFIKSDLPALAELPVPLMVSVAGFSNEEFKELISRVAEQPSVEALELNISCPNVKSGCVYGVDEKETGSLMSDVRGLTEKPIIVKLSPEAENPGSIAIAAEEGGADGVSLINTLRAVAVDPDGDKPALGAVTGGLSGPAIKPVALAHVRDVAECISIPIVGMGGVASGRDALDFLSCGARCIAVGTENFRDPMAAERVRRELEDLLARGVGQYSSS